MTGDSSPAHAFSPPSPLHFSPTFPCKENFLSCTKQQPFFSVTFLPGSILQQPHPTSPAHLVKTVVGQKGKAHCLKGQQQWLCLKQQHPKLLYIYIYAFSLNMNVSVCEPEGRKYWGRLGHCHPCHAIHYLCVSMKTWLAWHRHGFSFAWKRYSFCQSNPVWHQ